MKNTNSRKKTMQKKHPVARVVGISLCALVFIAAVVFIISLITIGMVPGKYIALAAALLISLWAILFIIQLKARRRTIISKIISVLLTAALVFGSFYIFKTNGMVEEISGNSTKLDTMVVAVLSDDPAKDIEDAAAYNFGVQYAAGSEQTTAAVNAINEEVGLEIQTTEYAGIQQEAAALFNGEVQAIIYNSAYAGILSDAAEDSGEAADTESTEETTATGDAGGIGTDQTDNVALSETTADISADETDTATVSEADTGDEQSTATIENYSDRIKIIYEYTIESTVENTAIDVAVEEEAFAVYISGIDVYGAIETTSRSDVNIIAVVNPTSHQILLVTTPRDYYVEIPGISGGQKDKLTHAGIYGVDASMATLASLYDMEIDFYARVNFTSLVEIVDALGGVDVDSEYAFTTSTSSGAVVNVVAGSNHFNGKEALAFSRERNNVPGGDFQRGKNQQAVIIGMIRKMISPAILTGANEILNSISGNVDTNMSTEQIQTLVRTQLDSPASWNIKSMAAEGTGDRQICYSMPGQTLYVAQPNQESVDDIKQAIDAVEAGEVLADSEVAE